MIGDRSYDEVAAMDIVIWTRARWAGPSPLSVRRPSPLQKPPSAPPPLFVGKSFPAKFDEENPSTPISSVLLVQADEGVSHLVVDRIDVVYHNLP
ncbi:hypothetical protein F511_08933 [Dorcoceras hygrometricum]|uniref:Uncharacterized protein n=1 Tax=Dorcoceras hygrometricum TaxID=472368 RepID=A0A2Z7A2N1_9LAMI|nr:hypothetical protein F511_08933 [Dorcoceras hygrometricum]